MRKKWTRCALKLYWLRNAPTTTAGIPSRHGAANSKFPAVVRTLCALVLLAQRAVEATSDRRHKGHPRFPSPVMLGGSQLDLHNTAALTAFAINDAPLSAT